MTLSPSTRAQLNIRLATPDDAPVLVDLIESAYRGDRSRTGWTTEADLLDGQRVDLPMVQDMIRDSTVLVAEEPVEAAPTHSHPAESPSADVEDQVASASSSVLGTVTLANEGDGAAYFGTFAVSPRAQGLGLGKQLMAWAEDYAVREFGASAMRMTVISKREELIQFYERRGYKRTGETEPFPYGQERFGLPKYDDLEFAVLKKALQ